MKRNFGLILVLLITLLVYFPSLFYHFVGDDYMALTRIVTSSHLREVFQLRWPGPLGGYFRALQWLPYLLGYALAGLPLPPDPRWLNNSFLPAYHLLNILFHLGNVFLVYLIASFVLKSRTYSALAALIFAVHPINAEVVCWIAVFGDIAFVFFSLLSLILFAKFYLSERKIPALLYYFGSLLSFILALYSKEAAICLPFLIILTVVFLRKIGYISIKNKRKVISISGYFLLVILYFILRKFVLPITGFPWQEILKDIPSKFVKLTYYLRDLTFPMDFSLLKEFLYHYSLLPLFIVVALLLGGLFLCIIALKFRQYPELLFSLAWIAITLIIPLINPSTSARRHVYFPLVGYGIFLFAFIPLLKKRYIGICLLSLLIILQIWGSLKSNALYGFSGRLMQESLYEFKKEYPEIEPDSIIYLVGVPGLARNITSAFWAAPAAKIRFIYQDKNLAVFLLSMAIFTEKSIKETNLHFLDNFTFEQTMETNLDEFMRITGEDVRQKDGQWITGFNRNYQFKILSRDKFGNIEKVCFKLNPQFLKGKKVYLVGFKEGKIKILKSFYAG